MDSPAHLARLLGARIAPGWPPGDYDRAAQEFFACRLKEEGTAVVGWYVWYAIRRADEYQSSMLVGTGGYCGPPDAEGTVEIGFSILPSLRGQGYATEMAAALVLHAFTDRRVQKIVARASPQNHASVKVLTRSGFRHRCLDRSGTDLFEIIGN